MDANFNQIKFNQIKFNQIKFNQFEWGIFYEDNHRVLQDNNTEPETWKGFPFFTCAKLETEEVPRFVEELWETPSEMTPGNWHHKTMSKRTNNTTTTFLERPWMLYNCTTMEKCELRPMQQLKNELDKNRQSQSSHRATNWAKNYRWDPKDKFWFIANTPEEKGIF